VPPFLKDEEQTPHAAPLNGRDAWESWTDVGRSGFGSARFYASIRLTAATECPAGAGGRIAVLNLPHFGRVLLSPRGAELFVVQRRVPPTIGLLTHLVLLSDSLCA